MRIEVTRAFFLAGEPQPVGKAVEVPDALGTELLALGKAVRSDAAAPVASRRKAKDEAAQ